MTKKTDTPAIRFKGFSDTWEQRKLGEVLSILKDGTHGTHQDAEEGPYLLSAKNIKNGQIIIDDSSDRKISEDEFNQIHTKFTLENGDILLTIVGSIGESAILENAGKFTFQRSVAFLRPSEEMTSRFLKTEIESVQFQKELNDRKSQSAQPGVYLGDLSKIPIYITSKEEQKKIGEYFSNLDHLITLHQREYEKLHNIKKSMLEKMFPKNGSNVPEIRFKGFTEAWEQRKLNEVGVVIDPHPSHRAPKEEQGGIPFIGIGDVDEMGNINRESARPVPENVYDEHHKRYDLNVPSLGLGRVASLGKVIRLRSDIGKYAISPTISVLQFSENINIDYLYAYMNTPQFKKQFEGKSNGSTRQSVGTEMVRLLNLSMPFNLDEQKAIGTFYKNLDNLITLHQRELEKLQNIKKSMLEKMFVSEEKRK